VTVLEVIQRSADYLARKGVDSARLQAELLLAHVLHKPRLKLYLEFERVPSEPELAALRELVRRRGAREPLQYLVGSVNFCGLELAVNPAVLIPRPETELLAERAWTFLAGRVGAPEAPAAALDFGTGSGCLAIALAVHCPAARIWAVDLSPAALEVARSNAARHGVEARIHFLPSDGFTALPAGERFDLIVANPPYIPTAEIARLQPEVRDHEPRAALDGGPDGLAVIRRLASEAAPWLKPGGRLMLELGDGQAETATALLAAAGWGAVTVENDWTNRPRLLIAEHAGA
jgi:release factor glutamine methyltransferase